MSGPVPDAADAPSLLVDTGDGRSGRLYFPGLEALRGWAVALVVLFHVKGLLLGDQFLAPEAPWWWCLAWAGGTGVTLFFVLSGFLLSLPFFAAARSGAVPSIASFYGARALRILPLYWLAVLVAFADTGQAVEALRAAVFVPVGFTLFPHSLPWWSLSTEVQFYLLLPLGARLALDRRGRIVLAVLLAAWAAAYLRYFRLDWWLESMDTGPLRNSLFGRAPNFLAGIVVAGLHDRRLVPLRSSSVARLLAGLVAAAFLSWLLHTVSVRGNGWADTSMPHWHAAEGAAWAVLAMLALDARGAWNRAWNNAGSRALGRISYGVYLFHLPVLFAVLDPWVASLTGRPAEVASAAVLARLAAGLLSLLVVAALAHRFVEEPCRRLRSSLSR